MYVPAGDVDFERMVAIWQDQNARAYEAGPHRAPTRAVDHELKCWPDYFRDVWNWLKTADLRKADREFRVGQALRLREWDPAEHAYTGRWVEHEITHVFPGGRFGLAYGYVMLSLGARLGISAAPPGLEVDGGGEGGADT